MSVVCIDDDDDRSGSVLSSSRLLVVCTLQARTTQPFLGKFVSKFEIAASEDGRWGMTVSRDALHLVVSHDSDKISVYTLPEGGYVRSIGGKGVKPGLFYRPRKMCFTRTGSLLVAEYGNKRVQEVKLTGEHVRFIGVDVIDDTCYSIATNDEVIVVGKSGNATNNRLLVFDAVTGAHVRSFGDYGRWPGQVARFCFGIRFLADGSTIAVVEGEKPRYRVSFFSITGEFIKSVGWGVLQNATDVEIAPNGDVIVSDTTPTPTVHVLSAETGEVVTSVSGCSTYVDGEFTAPVSLALCAGLLYVLDHVDDSSLRVQLFE